ncbi:creatininase family protein [Micrococcus luteus]|uniref:creatininase family protein n=1 Tax=Micrococcus luteus TaxID=1270 RepID=UPI0015D7E255|nr:creatininase family protein [Micrococcus luteus]
MRYAELTSPQVQELMDAGAVPVLAIGALEQHGHALPVGTDTLRAEAVVDRLAQRCGDKGVVTLPPLPYGVSPHHTRLPGTVTVPARLYCDLLVSLAESLADAGWRSLLVVTGHGGNRPALTLAQQELLTRRPGFHFTWAPVTGLARHTTAALPTTEVSGHSGEAETAQMLAIRPDLVRTEQLQPGATSLDELAAAPRLSRVPSPSLAVTFDQYHPTGVLGDPTTVTAEDGEEILAEVLDRLEDYVQHLRAL